MRYISYLSLGNLNHEVRHLWHVCFILSGLSRLHIVMGYTANTSDFLRVGFPVFTPLISPDLPEHLNFPPSFWDNHFSPVSGTVTARVGAGTRLFLPDHCFGLFFLCHGECDAIVPSLFYTPHPSTSPAGQCLARSLHTEFKGRKLCK